jgi:hypothetical protein
MYFTFSGRTKREEIVTQKLYIQFITNVITYKKIKQQNIEIQNFKNDNPNNDNKTDNIKTYNQM